MDRDAIIAALQTHADELRRAGVAHIALFGSVARGEAGPDSDVDLVIEGAPDRPVTFFTMARAQRILEPLLNRKVDLTAKQGLDRAPALRARIGADLTPVF